MYCLECGALQSENSRRCPVCGADFVFAIDMKKPIEQSRPQQTVDKKLNKMGYYNFVTWTQLPLTILAIIIIAGCLFTGKAFAGIQFTTGERSFDLAYGMIYATTYLPFAFYLEFALLNFRKNAGKVYAVFAVAQLGVEMIIMAALYFVYGVVPDVTKMVVVDGSRLVLWSIITVIYLKTRKDTFNTLREKKAVADKNPGKNMIIYNLVTWTVYPLLLVICVAGIAGYLVDYFTFSEAELIEQCCMEHKYVYIQLALLGGELVCLIWLLGHFLKKKVRGITSFVANILCAMLVAGTAVYDIVYYDNSVSELVVMDIATYIICGLLLLIAIAGIGYLGKRKEVLNHERKIYKTPWGTHANMIQ